MRMAENVMVDCCDIRWTIYKGDKMNDQLESYNDRPGPMSLSLPTVGPASESPLGE